MSRRTFYVLDACPPPGSSALRGSVGVDIYDEKRHKLCSATTDDDDQIRASIQATTGTPKSEVNYKTIYILDEIGQDYL